VRLQSTSYRSVAASQQKAILAGMFCGDTAYTLQKLGDLGHARTRALAPPNLVRQPCAGATSYRERCHSFVAGNVCEEGVLDYGHYGSLFLPQCYAHAPIAPLLPRGRLYAHALFSLQEDEDFKVVTGPVA
jgi:hypothetical protein